jgi:glycosyltransferase involved in cell wall biosynthesis
VLQIASSTASPRATKRHDLVAKLSEVPEVEVHHFGNWPGDVDPRNVRRRGMVTREEMARAYGQCDYFFHPAVKDPCPNAIFEAICSGLPVIYNSGPGSSGEIVGPNGFALDESSLSDTVEIARGLLPELKAAVIRNRAYYTIRRATGQYRNVFDMVAAEIHNR